MELKFFCEKCGNEIYPKKISHEEAENLNSNPLFLKSDAYYVISLCDCSFTIQKDIIVAVQNAIKDIKTNEYKS